MNRSIKKLAVAGVLLAALFCGRAWSIEESSFSKALVPGKYILNANKGYWNWCMAPIYDENGKLHVFVSIIPNNGSWSKNSTIGHFVADSVEGPFTFVKTAFASDESTYHNPQISKVGDTYVLVFLMNRYKENGSKQEVGIATAKSLDGPWTESPLNPVIKASGEMGGFTVNHASNPTFVVAEDGKYRIYYKSMTNRYPGKGFREISLAVSDKIEGPYVNYPENPVISYADKGVDIEDPYAFRYKGMYYMIVEDRTGVANLLEGVTGETVKPGGWRPGLFYESKDGINWGKPKLGYHTNESYFGDKLARSERPNILWKDGKPEYLFLACHDEKPSAGYFLKINDWDPAGGGESAVEQRADSCVIMDIGQARSEGDRLNWQVNLQHPGTYVVQLVTDIGEAKGEHTGSVRIDGKPLGEKLEKAYIIEDGLVSEFTVSATFAEAGVHAVSVQSNLAVKKVRLVPQGYVKSRISISSDKYYDAWLKMHESPEKLAAMEWYKQARFGMFIHWGAYSEAAGSWKGEPIEKGQGPKVAEWIMFAFKISREEYREFAKQFNPDKSFAVNIAKLAKDAGMKYVVITAKHHDGFALFDSAHSDFDIADSTNYDGDLIKELYDACRAEGIDFGVYYSHGKDWVEGCDSNYAKVKEFNDRFGVETRPNGINLWDPSPHVYEDYLEKKAYPQIAELIGLLPDLRLIWFDGEGLITEAQAFRFYKMIYDLNPNIVVSRRVGYDFGDYVDAGDNKTPAASELAAKHFETCGTANHSWGFKAQDHDWKSSNQLLRNFVDIVSKGGNYLLNIGPDGKGHVPTPCVDSFREMGDWVKTNADAIFGTTRWTTFSEGVTSVKKGESKPTEFWFSQKGDKVYAMSLAPASGKIRILSLKSSVGQVAGLRLLGSGQELKWAQTAEGLEIDFAGVKTSANGYAVEVSFKGGASSPNQ